MDNEENELVPVMSSVGWFVVETIERMQVKSFTDEEICAALDLPTVDHMYYLLAWAERERDEMMNELSQ